MQSEVCICNKVSVSADRLSTHTNIKNKLSLIVRNVRHFDSVHNGPLMMPRFQIRNDWLRFRKDRL